jgi:hypothetical protein
MDRPNWQQTTLMHTEWDVAATETGTQAVASPRSLIHPGRAATEARWKEAKGWSRKGQAEPQRAACGAGIVAAPQVGYALVRQLGTCTWGCSFKTILPDAAGFGDLVSIPNVIAILWYFVGLAA